MSAGADRQPLRRDPRLEEQLAGLLAPVVSTAEMDLEAVQITPAGRRRLLRVVVDRDGGVDLDGIATASHAIAAALDGSDVMGAQPYVLEVSSPGVDRPLTAPRHWRRAQGRLVRAELVGGGAVTGRVVRAGETAATVDVDGHPHELEYAGVAAARVQVEFARLADARLADADLAETDLGDTDLGDATHDAGTGEEDV